MSHLHILGLDYTVSPLPLSDIPTSEANVSHNTLAISIASYLSAPKQGAALVHELVEVADELLELSLPHNQIQSLSALLYQILVDNPHIITKILDLDLIVESL